MNENAKKPYTNYSRPIAPQVAKPAPVEDVAVNAIESAPAEVVDTKKEATIEKVKGDIVKTKFVNTNLLNVRSTPDADINNIIDQLKKDTEVNVIEEVGEFSKIGEHRYVMTQYLI